MVSVVMPTYNCGEYLDQAIRSALDQSYKDLEIVVVDGGSTDKTDEIARSYRGNTRFTYVKKPGLGISASRNYGIKIAKGELIAFLDGDDLFLKDKILKQVKFFEKNKNRDISYTNMIYFNSATRKEILSTYYYFSGDIFYYLKRSNFIHPSAVMARKSVFRENLFDEKIPVHEDWELFLRMASKGIKFGYMKEPLTKIRIREKSITTDQDLLSETRRRVGLMAREYWKGFKKTISFTSIKGWKAVLRYLKFKIGSFLIGFPKKPCFNRPTPQDLLCTK